MKSLKTTAKRDAERLARKLSVEFDEICHQARLGAEATHALAEASDSESAQQLHASADMILSGVPQLIRLAACRVIEEQQRNPAGWLEVVRKWQSFYTAMKAGAVPAAAHRPAVEAQALLNGIELAIQGHPIPAEMNTHLSNAAHGTAVEIRESWADLCKLALQTYKDKVGASRYKLVETKLPEIKVQSTSNQHIKEGLLHWCRTRLNEVQPRTVKGQLDSIVSALRCQRPALEAPALQELRGVMSPRQGDRQSMPIRAIQTALHTLSNRPASNRVRNDYGGGASQFDTIAIEALAVLGMRPRELIQARKNSIITKEDVFGCSGVYLRIFAAKNKASERDIPLSDGVREVVDINRLREMLEWQSQNTRAPHGAVTSLNTRFRKITGDFTLYQMRHSWKDIAIHAGIDFEIRERLMGHRIRGIADVYGSGVPLRQGLDALLTIRREILHENKRN